MVLPDGFEKNIGSFTLVPCAKSTGSVDVPVDTLDNLLADTVGGWRLPVRLLKIDVEGYEQEVLRGATGVLKSHRPDVVIEAQSDEALREVQRRLSPLGYRVLECFSATPTYHLTCRGYLDYAVRRLNWKARGFSRRVRRRVRRLFTAGSASAEIR